MWTTETVTTTPKTAVYFLNLPGEGIIKHSQDLGGYPSTFYGDINYFIGQHYDIPLIPVDLHTAFTLGWIDAGIMAKNMPYLDDKVRAAIALVT